MILNKTVIVLLLCILSLAFNHYIVSNKLDHSALLYIICNSTAQNQTIACVCGGSILNQWLILSAGHCMEECISEAKVIATVGYISITNSTTHQIATYRMHENYDPDTAAYDICVLKLKKELRLGARISRVAVLRNPPLAKVAFLALWGPVDSKTGDLEGDLKYVSNIQIINDEDCSKLIALLPETSFCARVLNSNNNYLVQGDSGSALLIKNYIQIGLVSFRDPVVANITVYTDVSLLYDWIKRNSAILLCSPKT